MLHPKRKNEAQERRRLSPLARNDSKRFRSSAYIARSAPQLHSATQRPALRCAVRSIVQPPPALYSAQHCTAPSKALHPAQRAKTRPIAASKPSRLRKGGLLRFLCSISAHENRSADTRARSLCLKELSSIFGALGIPAQPNRVMVVPRNAHKADRSKRTKPVAKTGFVAFSLFD